MIKRGYAVKSFTATTFKRRIGRCFVAPINKYNIQSEFKFPGHTDYLNQDGGRNALMLMVQGNLE
jgi:4-hydroxythreonine-4-phosphate dehydrogenase